MQQTCQICLSGTNNIDKSYILTLNFDNLNSSNLNDNQIIDYIFGSGNSIDNNSEFFNKLMQKFGRDQEEINKVME